MGSNGNRFAGKVAIITGGARGQGEAEARLLVAEGASVMITDLLADEGNAVAASLGESCVFAAHDVTDHAQWAEVVDACVAAFGGVDILVNNAGIHWICPIESETAVRVRQAYDVNLIGPFLGMQSVIGPMRARGGGAIVNISSTAGIQGYPGHAAYGASKWALRGLTKTAAIELGHDGIRVNSVHPGPIDTPMLPADRTGLGDQRFAQMPIGRAGTAAEVAALVAFLASDDASFITGAEFIVDGGSAAGPSMRRPPA